MKILFTVFIFFSSVTAYGCSCLLSTPFENTNDLKSYDFIGMVKVDKLAPLDTQKAFGVRQDGNIGITVLELFKGEATTIAFDPSFSTDCAINVHIGEQWLFFGNIHQGKLTVDRCGYSIRYSDSTGMRNWYSGDIGPMRHLNKLRELYNHPLISNLKSKMFYSNGNVHIEQSIKNNKLNGKRKIYYPNGKVYMVEQFKDGERVGEKDVYFPNGQIMIHEEYAKGMVTKTLLYHDTTETAWYLNFQANNQANAIFGDKTRSKLQILQRLDSLRKTPTWGKQLQSIYLYSKDGRSYTRKFYAFDGKLEAETYLDWNKKIIEHTMYYPDGKRRSHSIKNQITNQEIEINYKEDGTKREFLQTCTSCKYYFEPNVPAATPDKAYIQ
ncbi:MAG: hypothetical protein EOP47_05815 [Sphingobacteriaceae bacterium]|nr:MAG: hypothetical protein EOP47_05815 [Sphingobacteriaceae bacterium]